MISWLNENKEWVFSGVGIFILTILGAVIFKKSDKKQIQKVGNGSSAIQVGRDLKVGDRSDGTK